jgi:hypothetical protein
MYFNNCAIKTQLRSIGVGSNWVQCFVIFCCCQFRWKQLGLACTHIWAGPFRLFNPFSPFAKITSVCFFVNKQTNEKLPFVRWANGKQIKEKRLGFRFPFEMAVYMYIMNMYTYMYVCVYKYIHYIYNVSINPFSVIYIYIYTHIYTENGTPRKQLTEVCFPWSANNKWLTGFAVWTNMPIYLIYEVL